MDVEDQGFGIRRTQTSAAGFQQEVSLESVEENGLVLDETVCGSAEKIVKRSVIDVDDGVRCGGCKVSRKRNFYG